GGGSDASGYHMSHSNRFKPASAGTIERDGGGPRKARRSLAPSPAALSRLLKVRMVLPLRSSISSATPSAGISFRKYDTTTPDNGFCPTADAAPPPPPPPPTRRR